MDVKPKVGMRVVYAAAMALTVVTLAGVTIWGNSSAPSIGAGVASRAEARTLAVPAALPLLLTAAPTVVATPTPLPPLLTGAPPASPPAVATIMPSAGITTNVAIPGTQGTVSIPNDAAGDRPLQVVVRPVPSPISPPSGLTVLSSIQISFTNLNDSSAVNDLEQDVTIEISYAGLGLSDSQLDRLVIYNASRDEYLPTTIDSTRKVAIARTDRFSTFTLARITGPIPRSYVPFLARESSDGW